MGVRGAVYLIDADTGDLRFTFHIDDDFDFGRRVAVDGDDVVIGGGLGMHRFDGRTGAHRTAYDPVYDGPLAAGGGRILVRGPGCERGGAHLLDAETGLPVETFCAPTGEGVLSAFPDAAMIIGDTILISDRSTGNGVVYVYGSCANGVLEPGEECDDGNLIDGDGCDHNCTATRCRNGVHTGGESCPFDDLDFLSSSNCADIQILRRMDDARRFARAAVLARDASAGARFLRFALVMLRRVRQLSRPSRFRPFITPECRAHIQAMVDLDRQRIRTVLRRR